ncbi:restriction endonuclease subunit S [Rhizobium leguminosarum]|uniref:restriction endonuclease subunit S n=1 Tax=Rhizobium leguminosarum TaxID=384 RepID=UPI0015B9FBFD|nr:restriction endonuclease subunit S [Rhizobium leguminosarum]
MTSIDTLLTDHLDLWTSAIARKSSAGRGRSMKFSLYGIDKLRSLLLDLAVRGKLVRQDPADEPASELLKRIDAERRRQISGGKVKRGKPLKAPDEIPFPIPHTWVWSQLGAVTNYGETEKHNPGEVEPHTWVLELEDVEKATSRLIEKVRYTERQFQSQKNRFYPGDVIYGKLRPYLDKVLIADEAGVCTTEMVPIRPYAGLEATYLRLFLKAPFFISLASASTHGMNLPRLGTDRAREAAIAIPPLAEQLRIVAKVDELMALCDRLEAGTYEAIEAHRLLVTELLATLTASRDAEELADNWARVEAHFDTLFVTEDSVDQLKQAILQLAVVGRLVPQDPKDEPASELLKRINAEKMPSKKRDRSTSSKESDSIALNEMPGSLPKGWEWSRFSSVADVNVRLVHPASYQDHWQVAPDIIEKATGRLLEKRTVYQSGINGPNSIFSAGQIIYSKIRPSLSKVVKVDFDGLCSADMYPLISHINSDYLLNVILSEVFLSQVRKVENRVKMPKLNVESLNNIIVPVAPIAEQARIISKINELSSLCDAMKSALSGARAIELDLSDALVAGAVSDAQCA